ncbi:MAG: pilus assembly protein PilM [Gammaproteobacteria bacterium]|nr:pilus assembly protein PilM [Gammaproteobacteria bacterium]NND60104.1 pilus assembly protein PilM [Gammaproteobacteria bacterium]
MSVAARLQWPWQTARRQAQTAGSIGIDLALERMHLVQLCRDHGDALTLKAQSSVAYPVSRADTFDTPGALTPLIRAALRDGNFTGKRAVVALPGGSFRTFSLAYQVSPGQNEARVLSSLLEDRVDGSLSDYVIDYIPVRKRSRDADRLALVAVSPRSQVVQYLEEFRRARLEVEALEISPLAIRRLVSALPTIGTDDNVIVVNTGRACTYVTVLAGRRLLSDKVFDFGEDALLAKLSESLDMPTDAAYDLVMRTGLAPLNKLDQVSVALNESGIFNTMVEIIKPELMRLVAEIERAVLFTASETHGGKVSQIHLVGALSRWHGVNLTLGQILGFEVANLAAPLHSFDQDNEGGSPDMAVAAGLALRGLSDDD